MEVTHRVFVSGTSADLASYRNAVREALLTKGVLPVEQTNFPPDFLSVRAVLEGKIHDCDAVICLVGWVYGAEPREQPEGRPRRSYTQMEYDVARLLGKPVYQFLSASSCVFDAQPEESAEARELQAEHRKALESGDVIWELFANREQLRERVAEIRFDRPGPGQARPRNLPYASLGRLFKGRESFLSKLRERLLAQFRENNAGSAMRITQPQALCGLGGVGKTRLAVEYGWRYSNEYNAVLFVVADSPDTLRRNVAQLTGPMVLNLTEWNRQEEEVKMAAAIRWLLEHPGWFMILDNVDSRPAAEAVEELIARIPGGHVLITSRLEDWSKDVEPLELDVISAEDSKSFLLERTQSRRRATAQDGLDAATLCRELDGLALALEQAGAFIERQRCSIEDYLKRWRAGETRVRQWFDPRVMHYPRSVAITYDTTMLEVGPVASALFQILCWFAPDPLPETLLTSAQVTHILAAMTGKAGIAAAQIYPDEALAELVSFSMIKKQQVQEVPCIHQHRLVSEVGRSQMPEAEQSATLKSAMSLFANFAPRDAYRFEAWKDWRLLISHAEMLWSRASTAKSIPPNLPLMEGLSLYYLGQERFGEAIPIQRQVLEAKKKGLGSDSGEVWLAVNDLALMLDSCGQVAEAQSSYREALAGWKRVGSGDYQFGYPETLHNLGVSLTGTGQFEDAEKLLQEALAIFETDAGPYHWRTLMAEYSLAKTKEARGQREEAIRLLRANIEKKTVHLPQGPFHPDTIDSNVALAQFLVETGALAEAEAIAQAAVEGRERSLGRDDKRTLEAVLLLQAICAREGKTERANALEGRIVEAGIRSGDPQQLTVIRQAAYGYYLGGEYARAEDILRSLIEKRFEVAGNYCHLARIYIVEDRISDAEDVVARAWELRSGAPAYVLPRIRWLRLALLAVSGNSLQPRAEATSRWLGRIKSALTAKNAFMEWKMDPVLSRIREKLPGGDYDLLAALVAAFSNSTVVAALEQFPVWSELSLIALDEAPDLRNSHAD